MSVLCLFAPVLAAFFIGFVQAYPYQPSFSKLQANVDCQSSPTPLSFHVHVTYMLTNEQQIKDVQAFREVALKHFAPLLGENPVCQGTDVEPSGRYDNGRFCFIYDHDLTNDTLGPFAVGEWSAFVPVHYYGAVVPWFVQNRGQFNLLVHPNTGCEYEDHSIWAQWSGSAWNMDMSIFTAGSQTNEFGEELGSARNPTCLPKRGVCGVQPSSSIKNHKNATANGNDNAYYFGPQIACCAGSACVCEALDGRCFCN